LGDLDRAMAVFAGLYDKKPYDAEIEGALKVLFAEYARQKRDINCGAFRSTWYLAGAFCSGRNDDKKDWNKAIEDYKFIDENLLPGLLKQAVHLQIAEA
jgi:hypothetical protein